MVRVRHGFTLVELLTVIVILGILAAIVVPQFTDASTDAKESSLKTNLQTIRGQIALYKLQHDDTLPSAAAGSGPPYAATSFEAQMTLASKPNGQTAAIGTSGFDLGPYLQSIPNNPFTNTNTVGTSSATAGTTGWVYDNTTGQFRANNAGTDSDGVAFTSY